MSVTASLQRIRQFAATLDLIRTGAPLLNVIRAAKPNLYVIAPLAAGLISPAGVVLTDDTGTIILTTDNTETDLSAQ